MNTPLPIATLLLAAGSSSRLGEPKQLVRFGESTLLRHAAEIALSAALGPVYVVLGCHEAACRDTLADLAVEIVSHPGWAEGLGSSIAAGMRHIDESRHRAALLLLSDQPLLTSADLQSLARLLPGPEIVATDHGGAMGPPALFAAALFPALRALRGPEGAKSLLRDSTALASIPCPRAAIDIDTPADVVRLREA